MSEERDRDLSRHYRAASAELPPPALGRALRAAAAQAVAAPPKRWQRKWGVPMAMAASVVLGLGMVLRVALERPDLQPASAPVSVPARVPDPPVAQVRPAESAALPSAVPAPEAKVRSQARSDAAAPPAVAPQAAERQSQQQVASAAMKRSPAPAEQASIPEAKPPVSADSMAAPAAAARDQARAESSMRVPPFATAPAPPPPAALPAPAPAPAPESARPQSQPLAESAVGQSAGQTDATTSNAAVQERRAAAPMAPAARAKALGAGAAQSADSNEPGIAAEALLAPEAWLRRIVTLRQAGRHVEADASLARFVRRYPDHRVPEQARPPQP